MSQGLNNCQVIGNLGHDPEVRYSANGNAVANLRLAVGERKKTGDKWEDHTEWISVTVFGKTAESVATHLSKGRQLFVEGRFQTREYVDKDGNKRSASEIVARNVIFLGSKPQDDKRSREGPKGDARATNLDRVASAIVRSNHEPDRNSAAGMFKDDDLPF